MSKNKLKRQKIETIQITEVYNAYPLEYGIYQASNPEFIFDSLEEAEKEINYIMDNFGTRGYINPDGELENDTCAALKITWEDGFVFNEIYFSFLDEKIKDCISLDYLVDFYNDFKDDKEFEVVFKSKTFGEFEEKIDNLYLLSLDENKEIKQLDFLDIEVYKYVTK
jgi:hypothetical protein